MAVELLNRQRRFTIEPDRVVEVAEGALGAVDRAGAEVSVTITNDRKLRELNARYRGKDRPTDVLSFPYEGEVAGDVVISIDRAYAQALERGHSLQRELELLALHGVLHVCGYDHETDDGEMDRLERRLRRRLVRTA
jgi:rRNA maturation RNase YbeY